MTPTTKGNASGVEPGGQLKSRVIDVKAPSGSGCGTFVARFGPVPKAVQVPLKSCDMGPALIARRVLVASAFSQPCRVHHVLCVEIEVALCMVREGRDVSMSVRIFLPPVVF